MPSYLADSLCHAANVSGRRHLHMANTVSLVIPPTHCFSLGCNQSVDWNNLLLMISASPLLLTYYQQLKL